MKCFVTQLSNINVQNCYCVPHHAIYVGQLCIFVSTITNLPPSPQDLRLYSALKTEDLSESSKNMY